MVTETRLSQDIIRAYETQITKAFDWDLHLIVPLQFLDNLIIHGILYSDDQMVQDLNSQSEKLIFVR